MEKLPCLVCVYIYIYVYIFDRGLKGSHDILSAVEAFLNQWELCNTKHCFIVWQLFSVSRHLRCFKLESKPGWFYLSDILHYIYHQLSVSERIFKVYIHIDLSALYTYICIYISLPTIVKDDLKTPIFSSYYTKVSWKVLLLTLDCSTYPWSILYNVEC